jgi:predicted DNA-binding ribbon-helix-helix protein
VKIYTECNDVLDHMFNACTTAQISEFIPEKRGFRIHGHSTTVCLERAFWNVLDDMARETGMSLPRLIERVHDGCLVANDKNISSCLRVICLKYLNIYAAAEPERTAPWRPALEASR